MPGCPAPWRILRTGRCRKTMAYLFCGILVVMRTEKKGGLFWVLLDVFVWSDAGEVFEVAEE